MILNFLLLMKIQRWEQTCRQHRVKVLRHNTQHHLPAQNHSAILGHIHLGKGLCTRIIIRKTCMAGMELIPIKHIDRAINMAISRDTRVAIIHRATITGEVVRPLAAILAPACLLAGAIAGCHFPVPVSGDD